MQKILPVNPPDPAQLQPSWQFPERYWRSIFLVAVAPAVSKR